MTLGVLAGAVAAVAAALCARYYVLGVLDGERTLSRWGALLFVSFAAVATMVLGRALWA